MKKALLFGASLLTAILFLTGCTNNAAEEEVAPAPTVTPAPQISSISGTLSISGAVVQDSTALMLERKVGETTYREFDRIPAADGLQWSFDTAIEGQTYEITVALQVDEQNKASGNVVTALAPATGQKLFVDTDFNLSSPNQSPEVSCGTRDDAGGFNATITYKNVPNAKGYYYQVGTSPGTDNIAREFAEDSGVEYKHTEATVYVKENMQYYTRYAYTLCTDCNKFDTQNWSSWSPTLGFVCPPSAQPMPL